MEWYNARCVCGEHLVLYMDFYVLLCPACGFVIILDEEMADLITQAENQAEAQKKQEQHKTILDRQY